MDGSKSIRKLSVVPEEPSEQQEVLDPLEQKKAELTAIQIELDKRIPELADLDVQLTSMHSIAKEQTQTHKRLQAEKKSIEDQQQVAKEQLTNFDKDIERLSDQHSLQILELELLERSVREKKGNLKIIESGRTTIIQKKAEALTITAETNETLKSLTIKLTEAEEKSNNSQLIISTFTEQQKEKQATLEMFKNQFSDLQKSIIELKLAKEIAQAEKEKKEILSAAEQLMRQKDEEIAVLKQKQTERKPNSPGVRASSRFSFNSTPSVPRILSPITLKTASTEAIEWVKKNQEKIFAVLSSSQSAFGKDKLNYLISVYNLMSESKLNIDESPLKRSSPSKNPEITEIIKSLATAKKEFAGTKSPMSPKSPTSSTSIFKKPSCKITPLLDELLSSLVQEFPAQVAAHNQQYAEDNPMFITKTRRAAFGYT